MRFTKENEQMTKTITNKEDMKELLQECGWRKSALLNDWYINVNEQYVDVHGNEKLNYGMGQIFSCDISYPVCVVQSYDPHDMRWYWVIKQNGISINLSR